MTLYALKPRFQMLLRAPADWLLRLGASADQLTAAGVLFAALAGVLLALAGPTPWLWLVPPLLFARIACNALDGMLARTRGSERPMGVALNELGDRLADLLCFGGLLAGGHLQGPAALALLPLMLLVSHLGLLGQAMGGARRSEGPLGKAERMLALALYCVAAPFFAEAGALFGWILVGGLAITLGVRLCRVLSA